MMACGRHGTGMRTMALSWTNMRMTLRHCATVIGSQFGEVRWDPLAVCWSQARYDDVMKSDETVVHVLASAIIGEQRWILFFPLCGSYPNKVLFEEVLIYTLP